MAYGRLMDGEQTLDEVVAAIFRAPKSYTGEDVVELSCHGSPMVHKLVLQALLGHGARYARAGEFTQRAFLNGKLDLAQAEAVADLLEARSPRAHHAALGQLRGGVSRQIAHLREQLLEVAALLELELDFGEEDVEFADRTRLLSLVGAGLAQIAGLVGSFGTGNAVKNGVVVVIAGAPNVGKSTLLNALVGEDRAIVSEIPGTTRDTIEDTITLDGWLIRFVDTAGLRETTDTVESLGIERTYTRLREADVVIRMVAENDNNNFGLIDKPKNIPVIDILNKADQLDLPITQPSDLPADLIYISAKNVQGVDTVKEALIRIITSTYQGNTNTLVTNQRHLSCLQLAGLELDQVRSGLGSGLPTDLLAHHLRQALNHLGEITGQVTADEILGAIFGRFCIGK